MSASVQYTRRRLARIGAPAVLDDLGADEFSGYASLFGIPDGAGDVVARGAFAASLRRRPPEKVRMLYQHFAHEPIGVWQEIHENVRGLYVRGRLLADVSRSREVMALIREGAVSGLSIGFRTVRATRDPATRHRILNEIELWEISIVTFPLLKESQVTAVGAAHLSEHVREAAKRMLSA
jgi:uncharacterized protein